MHTGMHGVAWHGAMAVRQPAVGGMFGQLCFAHWLMAHGSWPMAHGSCGLFLRLYLQGSGLQREDGTLDLGAISSYSEQHPDESMGLKLQQLLATCDAEDKAVSALRDQSAGVLCVMAAALAAGSASAAVPGPKLLPLSQLSSELDFDMLPQIMVVPDPEPQKARLMVRADEVKGNANHLSRAVEQLHERTAVLEWVARHVYPPAFHSVSRKGHVWLPASHASVAFEQAVQHAKGRAASQYQYELEVHTFSLA